MALNQASYSPFPFSSLLLPRLELSDTTVYEPQQSMSLKYEPSSEPLHIVTSGCLLAEHRDMRVGPGTLRGVRGADEHAPRDPLILRGLLLLYSRYSS